MNDENAAEPLRFDFAGDAASSATCATCERALVDQYFECNGLHVCEICKVRAEEQYRNDKSWVMMPKALLFGFGAALAGCILYYLFLKVFKIELGLMAIGVGWLVGKAVMRGSNYRGGRRYQVVAVTLTYLAITFSYVPLFIESFVEQRQKKVGTASDGETKPSTQTRPAGDVSASGVAAALGMVLLIILAAPFLQGFSNILGWLIIAFGLWEAWKFTREVPFGASGPYELKPAGAAPAEPPALPDPHASSE
jgi:hypothetical protein